MHRHSQRKNNSQNSATKPSTKKFSYSDSGRSAAAMEDFMAKAPKTKAQFVDRFLMADFSGDIRDLFPNREVKITRLSPNKLDIYDINNQKHFTMAIQMPRSQEQIDAANAKRGTRQAGKAMSRKRAAKPAADKGAHH